MTSPILERVRRLCLSWPATTERLSHGEPSWFIGDNRMFVTYADHHHDDRVAFWCASPPGSQDVLIESEPGSYFVPPYVGHRGWLGVYLDVELGWDAIRDRIGDAYHTVAAKAR